MTKIDFLITRDKCRAEEGNKRDVELIKAFLAKGYSCGMISSCQIIHSQLEKEDIFSVQLLKEIKVPKILEDMEKRAERIESEYEIFSLNKFIFPEKCYYGEEENYLTRKAIVYFEWLEKFFDDNEIKCLIQGQGGQINVRTLYFIAKKRGIPVIYFGEHLFPNKMLLFSDEMKNWFGFKNINWDEMTNQQKEEIDNHINDFKNKKGIISYSLTKTKKDKIVRSFIGFQEYIRNKQLKGLKSAIIRKFERSIKNFLNQFLSGFIYQHNIKNEKFIYFPLHIPDDSQITLRNPQFFDQAVLALYMARSLPFGYKLYIKEHPGSFLSVQDKRKLSRENNIAVLQPKINSHKIVEQSKAIIVINSTVGFESLHYFKPVIILGNWGLLKGKGVSTDVQDLSDLAEKIKSALKESIDKNKIKAYLFSLKKSMFKGSTIAPKMNYNEVIKSLVEKYKELLNEK